MTEMKEPQFLFVEIENGYTIKYDGYREKNHWTLLRTKGGRVFDGTFQEVISYLSKETKPTEKFCPTCGRLIITSNGRCIKDPHNDVEKTQYTFDTNSDWICKKCLTKVKANEFHICPTWGNFDSEPE